MKYLLDTNACIALMTGEQNHVRTRFEEEVRHHEFCISTVILFELMHGVHKSVRSAQSAERLRRFLAAKIEVLDFQTADAEAAGKIRAELERKKQPIGSYDTLIAGQALARELTLVTANVREFSRVPGLRWQDWAAKSQT